jgi:hypothetical protein
LFGACAQGARQLSGVEVETAITRGDDLNSFVFSAEEDELTLLHIAVINGHHDSLQRLLNTGEVQMNK